MLSFLATDAVDSSAPGTRTPSPASSPSVATRTSAGQLAAARGPGPTGRQGEPARAERAQLLGHLRRRRRQRRRPAARTPAPSVPARRAAAPPAGAAALPGAPRPAPGRALPSAGSPSRPVLEQLLEALPDRLHLEPGEDVLGVLQVPPAERQLADVDQERHVGDQRDDLGVGPCQVLVGGQVLAQLGRELVEVGEDPVQIPVARSAAWPPSSPPLPAPPAGCPRGRPAGRPAARTARVAPRCARRCPPRRRARSRSRRACCRAPGCTGPGSAGSCRGRRSRSRPRSPGPPPRWPGWR